MEFNIWGWLIILFIILSVFVFWSLFIYLTVNTIQFKGVSIETFDSSIGPTAATKFYPRSRSVELYNPSAYTGMFTRKFEVPYAYTRTDATFPYYSALGITKKYSTTGTISQLKQKNLLGAPWNVPDVYPLKNRRLILV